MIRRVVQRVMKIVQVLRIVAETIAASVAGVRSMVTDGGLRRRVELTRGDRAPDFTLPGSDGRTYRLNDLLGRGETIVMAWFPKAFTGG